MKPRTKVYRKGVCEAEGFEVARVSDFLAESDTVALSLYFAVDGGLDVIIAAVVGTSRLIEPPLCGRAAGHVDGLRRIDGSAGSPGL